MNRKLLPLISAIVLLVGVVLWFAPLRTIEGVSHLDYASKLCEPGDTAPTTTHYHILKGELGEYRTSAKEISDLANTASTADVPKCQQDKVMLSL